MYIFNWMSKQIQYDIQNVLIGWIPGILGFSTQINLTQILIVDWNQLWKSFRMIPKSPRSSRILRLKIDFSTFAWAKPWMGSPRKFREYSQQIRWWIWNILIVILYTKMTSIKNLMHLIILRVQHLRIWVPPTQFRKFSKNLKIEFSGN